MTRQEIVERVDREVAPKAWESISSDAIRDLEPWRKSEIWGLTAMPVYETVRAFRENLFRTESEIEYG